MINTNMDKDENKPDEESALNFDEFLVIYDPETEEKIVEQRV